MYQHVHFALTEEFRIRIKESEKLNKYLKLAKGQKVVEQKYQS